MYKDKTHPTPCTFTFVAPSRYDQLNPRNNERRQGHLVPLGEGQEDTADEQGVGREPLPDWTPGHEALDTGGEFSRGREYEQETRDEDAGVGAEEPSDIQR